MDCIHFTNVTKRFGDTVATDNLSFSVRTGEIYGILGPNGAGKTTVIRQIMGLTAPDAGSIDVLGLEPQKQWKQMRSLVGLVPQETGVYPELSARVNLQFHASLYLPSMRNVRRRIDEVLELVDLAGRANEPVRTYSGGMKRRLAIGRSLLHEPQILILDEPTLGVDVQGTHTIWDYIRDLARAGTTILLTTNVMSEADYLCDRLLIIDLGRRVVAGTPDELKTALGEREIVIELEEMLKDEELKRFLPRGFTRRGSTVTVTAARGRGDLVALMEQLPESLPISSIEMKKPKLDDVFLHHTGRSLRE
jgi:ABC-2 type transport system ATP-binding protein